MKRALCLTALLASGCHFDHSVPPGTVIECKRDDDCPPDHVCAAVGQCRSALQPFAVTPTVAPSRGRAGQVFVIDLTSVEQPLAPPLIRLMTPSGQLVATVSDVTQQSATAFEGRWTATGTEPEGELQVLADLELKGRSLHLLLLGSVVLDFTPPSLTAHSLAYQPGMDNALAQVGLSGRIQAMGAGTTMVLQASLSEPLLGIPVVKASSGDGGTQLDFELVGAPMGNAYVFTLALPMDVPVPDDRYSVVLSARDLVGNAAALPAGTFDVLRTVPAAAAVDTPDALRFSRAPFGTVDGGPAYWIDGAPGATAGAGVLEVLAGTLPVALVDTDADGGFARADVNLDSDLTTVDVRFIDVAGNVSPKATVRDVSYYSAGAADGGAIAVAGLQVLWTTHGTAVPSLLTPLTPGAPLRVKGAVAQVDVAPRPYQEPRSFPTCRSLTAGTTYVMDYRYPATSVSFGSMAGAPSQAGNGWAPDSGLPPARAGAAIELDAWRGAVVLFGGIGDGGALADTWELIDQQWHASSAEGPAPRTNAAMTFDPDHRTLLMFGGAAQADGGGELSDTWLYIDGGWVNGPDAGPPARAGALLFYDRARKRSVLAGGLSGGAVVSDTWAFDGVRWQNLDAGLDAGAAATVCFNNETGEAQYGPSLFDGTTWQGPTQFYEPSSRIFTAAAWDERRQQVIAYGGFTWYVDCGCDCGIGYSYPALSDTWAWNGTAWRQLDGGLSGPPPADAGLYGLQGLSAAYDRSAQQVVMYGGAQTIPPYISSTQLWALQDDDSWAAVPLDAGTPPPVMNGPALRWSPELNGLMLEGVNAPSGAGQTWVIKDGQLALIGGGPAAYHHSLAWSPAAGAMMMRASNATYTFNIDGQWSALSVINDLTQTNQLLDVDTEHSRVLLWGSYGSGAMLETTAWESFPSGSGDNAGVVFDPIRRQLLVLGGSDVNYAVSFTKVYSAEVGAPAAYVAASLPTLPPGTAVSRVAVDAVAGGIGYDDSQSHAGAEVRFNLEGYWETLPGVAAPTPGSSMAPGQISFLLDSANLKRVARAVPQRLDLLFRPQLGNGRAGLAKVDVEDVFVRFDLRLPPSPSP
jgi:hypothetical protein